MLRNRTRRIGIVTLKTFRATFRIWNSRSHVAKLRDTYKVKRVELNPRGINCARRHRFYGTVVGGVGYVAADMALAIHIRGGKIKDIRLLVKSNDVYHMSSKFPSKRKWCMVDCPVISD